MIFPRGAATRTDPDAASGVLYDAVIVGGGVAGAIVANQLSQAGQRVLMLEAGPAEDLTVRGYEEYLSTSDKPTPPCPKCGSGKVSRLWSTINTEWLPSDVAWDRVGRSWE